MLLTTTSIWWESVDKSAERLTIKKNKKTLVDKNPFMNSQILRSDDTNITGHRNTCFDKEQGNQKRKKDGNKYFYPELSMNIIKLTGC